ncbi:hypothetical protein [Streptomyces cyanogenus]|uniref:Uncharacterized protein n=1 Tax=Streptomyces cyanogenus TaxID=80860 RepID=A0ABX7TMZ5_STRCY|nr:hypothetical protein [Streptomyces cyanogenus]QTD96973.1 hypothetical protein S1361_06390 [Streptomyces cyanogenus]
MTTFTDDFNRANGAPGANWVDLTGLWTIVSNQLSSGTAGGTIIIRAATAMATNDHSAQVTIAATGAVSHGVWCRGNTAFTSGYLWRNDGTSWVLFSNVGGSFTSIGSFSGAAVAGDVAKIQAVGSTIKGFVNGVARVTVTDTAVTTGTSVGLRAESTNLLRFDDFTAADVTSGVTGDAALSSTATLSASGLRATASGAAQAATAGLSAAGQLAAGGSASESVTATLTAGGTRNASAAASSAVTAAISAAGAVAAVGVAPASAAAGLSASGTAGFTDGASLAGFAGLSAGGIRGRYGVGAVAAGVALLAAGSVASAAVRGTSGPGVTASPNAGAGAGSAPTASSGKVLVPTASGGST